jgi:hypothetical protein
VSKRILLERSPTGVEHYAEIDSDGNELTLVEFTPTRIESEILDSCARARSVAQVKGRAFQLAARVPINTWNIWRKEWAETYSGVFTWQTFEAMKLNSRENANLRTGYKRSGSMKL